MSEKIFNETVDRARVGATSLWLNDEMAVIWAKNEIAQLRGKLEAANAELSDVLLDIGEIRSALNIPHDVTAVDGVKAAATAIREAQEQKPAIYKLKYLEAYGGFEEVNEETFNKHKDSQNYESEVFYAAPVPAMPIQDDKELEEYDYGNLNDFGGGNVSWWQDYIRSELGRAYEFYQAQIQSEVKPSC